MVILFSWILYQKSFLFSRYFANLCPNEQERTPDAHTSSGVLIGWQIVAICTESGRICNLYEPQTVVTYRMISDGPTGYQEE